MSDPREINRRMAEGYDRRPWEQDYPDGIEPSALQSLARPYGADRDFEDVLDLGCGTGELLVRAGSEAAGRLVGTEISSSSCALAREKLSRFGKRAEIVNADILDLEGDRLGQFDLIYCTGVIFVVPPDVRQRIAGLIGQCLRPGGAALISYYAGLAPAVRAHLGKSLRSVAADARDGREAVDLLRPSLGRQSHFTLALRGAFGHFDRLDDDFFFAEMLNGEFQSISTAELNNSLRPAGVGFATYLGFWGFKPTYRADDRALMADRFDLTDGAFRYALFVKPSSPMAVSEAPGPAARPVVADPLKGSPTQKLRRGLRHLFWLVFRV
jgi:SAM-dependent methyltransferase